MQLLPAFGLACDTTYRMRAARFFPLAFVANVHGFILLAPYLVLFLAVTRTLQVQRKANLKAGSGPIMLPVVVR